jgi:hypothetical protein
MYELQLWKSEENKELDNFIFSSKNKKIGNKYTFLKLNTVKLIYTHIDGGEESSNTSPMKVFSQGVREPLINDFVVPGFVKDYIIIKQQHDVEGKNIVFVQNLDSGFKEGQVFQNTKEVIDMLLIHDYNADIYKLDQFLLALRKTIPTLEFYKMDSFLKIIDKVHNILWAYQSSLQEMKLFVIEYEPNNVDVIDRLNILSTKYDSTMKNLISIQDNGLQRGSYLDMKMMRVLAIITSIVLPINLIFAYTGSKDIPTNQQYFLKWKNSYLILSILIVIITMINLYIFRFDIFPIEWLV